VSPVQSIPTSPAKGLNLPNPSTGTNESTQSKKAAKEIVVPDLQAAVAVSGRLTEAEKMEKGSIPWSTFHLYIKSAGGYIISCFVLLTFVLNIFSTGTSPHIGSSEMWSIILNIYLQPSAHGGLHIGSTSV
jgi:hypothetical protein